MTISIATLFPELYSAFLNTSLIKRSQEQGIVNFDISSLFDYSLPGQRIDGPTFGHGSGMLIKPKIIESAVQAHENRHGSSYKIFFSPHGKKFDQKVAKQMAAIFQEKKHLLLFPARYEGVDARAEEEYADQIISMGDFVLMGGDIPAMLFLESVLRFIPGVVGKQESVELDSFSGALLDYPEYTTPVSWKNRVVPDIVRSGDHKKIKEWQTDMSFRRTFLQNFEWFRKNIKSVDRDIASKKIPKHYAVIMHSEVNLPGNIIGTTSVTSLDIHDIARSARTYGFQGYFIVTPLLDQQKIVEKLLSFWKTAEGMDYNAHRHEALDYVSLYESLDKVIDKIEQSEGKKPVLIATSARNQEEVPVISYYDQGKVWSCDRPVLLILGTGHGLSSKLISRCDYVLMPLSGLSSFNHLSVRSAAAIIFDRWLGMNPVN